MSITLPTPEAVAYACRFSISAIYLIRPANKHAPLLIGAATDIGRSAAVLARKYPAAFGTKPPVVLWAMWGERRAISRLLFSLTRDVKGCAMSCDVPVAIGCVVGMAQRLKTPLSSHDNVMHRVGGATAKISARVEGARQSGALSGINKLYREHRLRAQRDGRRVLAYPQMVSKLQRLLAGHAAAKSIGELPPNIIATLFDE